MNSPGSTEKKAPSLRAVARSKNRHQDDGAHLALFEQKRDYFVWRRSRNLVVLGLEQLDESDELDVDVFVHFETLPGSLLITPKPIFDHLSSKGYRIEGEYVHEEGWPVQFLPPGGPLVEEAIDEAVSTDVDGVPTRVFGAEHLVAIALKTGRAKDKARILQFIESGVLDADRLQAILGRHDLLDRWERFERQFFSE